MKITWRRVSRVQTCNFFTVVGKVGGEPVSRKVRKLRPALGIRLKTWSHGRISVVLSSWLKENKAATHVLRRSMPFQKRVLGKVIQPLGSMRSLLFLING